MITVTVGIICKGEEVTHSEGTANDVISAIAQATAMICDQMDSYPNQQDMSKWESVNITVRQLDHAPTQRRGFARALSHLFTI